MSSPRNKGRGAGIAFIRAHLADEDGPCLIWPMNRDVAGYGFVSYLGTIHRAHRLTCELANGPAPSPDHYATHSCGNGHLGCVHPKHLGWETPTQNQHDRRIHGTSGLGKTKPRYKLTPDQVAAIRSMIGQKTQAELASMYNIRRQTVGEILRGEIWKTGQYSPYAFNAELATAAARVRWVK